MASISEIQELAMQLSLSYTAKGAVDLHNEKLSNLDYLKYVLESELAERNKAAIQRKRAESRLPRKTFNTSNLNPGVKWHVEQLGTLSWLQDSTDITILGRCDSGKTSLAVHLGELALQEGMRVYYCDVDEFLNIMRGKDHVPQQQRKFRCILNSDLLIIDELMYVALSEQDLPLFYRAINFLREERSIIYITNRELSEWPQVAEDKHLMETLTQKITSGSQFIRL